MSMTTTAYPDTQDSDLITMDTKSLTNILARMDEHKTPKAIQATNKTNFIMQKKLEMTKKEARKNNDKIDNLNKENKNSMQAMSDEINEGLNKGFKGLSEQMHTLIEAIKGNNTNNTKQDTQTTSLQPGQTK